MNTEQDFDYTDDDTDDDTEYENYNLSNFLSNAVKARPEYELRAMLSLHKSDSLKKLARTYKMKGYASSKKSDMIEFLCRTLDDSGFIEHILLHTNDEEYDFFESIAVSGKLDMTASEAINKPYHIFRTLYFMDFYSISGKITFVIPDVIRNIYLDLCKTPFPSTRKTYSMIDTFATAFTTLYGMVDFDYFIDICNSQLQVNMDYVELANILFEFTWLRDASYTVFGSLLIHSLIDEHTVETEVDENVIETSNAEVDRLETVRDEIPIKDLPVEEILKYSDKGYYEHTPAHDQLIPFLKAHDPELMQIPAVQQHILGNLRRDLSQNDDIKVDLLGFEFRKYESDIEAMKTYNDLIRDVERHTRKWSKNGWTLAEIEAENI